MSRGGLARERGRCPFSLVGILDDGFFASRVVDVRVHREPLPNRGIRSIMFDLTFLGPSASVPSAERNHPGLLVEAGGDRILVDCGAVSYTHLTLPTIYSV